jgi:site-specific DNA-methyltransferase (adenine-specific)
MIELNKIILADCMDIMKDIPDKYFELAIVDPPYGWGGALKGRNKSGDGNDWNISPDEKYFIGLFRISKNQIIWGGNYFNLPATRCFIIWDKKQPIKQFARCEIAWTSFDLNSEIFEHKYFGNINADCNRFHPCQKPVALYRWILQNYAKPGDKIIDTHSGSGSLACACHLEKFDFLAIEKDEDYYKASCERLETLRSQGTLF